MADTIITNSDSKDGNSSIGWVVVLIVVVALIAGGIYLYQTGAFRGAPPADSTNINVEIPNPQLPTGGAGAGGGGAPGPGAE